MGKQTYAVTVTQVVMNQVSKTYLEGKIMQMLPRLLTMLMSDVNINFLLPDLTQANSIGLYRKG